MCGIINVDGAESSRENAMKFKLLDLIYYRFRLCHYDPYEEAAGINTIEPVEYLVDNFYLLPKMVRGFLLDPLDWDELSPEYHGDYILSGIFFKKVWEEYKKVFNVDENNMIDAETGSCLKVTGNKEQLEAVIDIPTEMIIYNAYVSYCTDNCIYALCFGNFIDKYYREEFDEEFIKKIVSECSEKKFSELSFFTKDIYEKALQDYLAWK